MHQNLLHLMHCYVEKQVFSWCTKKVQICCIITWKSRFSHDATENKVYTRCIITWKSRFSHDAPNTLIFDALLRVKAGFLKMRQKSANLLPYYVEKQVFSWRTKNSYIWCIITWKNRFSHDAPKRCIFVAMLRRKAGFLMTRQILLYLMHYYVKKQVFSRCAKKVQICCLITWKSRFSHDAPKILIFDALLRGKAGFLMTRQKGANLLQCYVEKQVFSWCAKISYVLCIITWKSRFSHDAPKKCKFVALLRGKAGFLITRQKLLYFMYYYVEKQVFSWHAKKVQICCTIMFRSRFFVTRQKLLHFMHCYVEKQVFAWCDKKVQIFCIITWKSRFSNDVTENKVYTRCIITFQSRFSHDAPKTLIFDAFLSGKTGFLMTWPKTKCIFDALLRFKAGFLVTRQKLLHLMHCYVEKQVFSWCVKKVQICCIITWKSRCSHDVTENKVYTRCIVTFQSRFSHDAPKTLIFVALLRGKKGFFMMRQKGANLLHYNVEKQVFSWRPKTLIFYAL